ncbi:MAG: hypothetical protein EBY21_06385 [Alphaproteobacteria bacterium]|nr:hypothetical protein [Alphaproteobacteria bacterium]
MKYLGLLAAEMLMIALGSRLAHAADMGSFSQPSPDYFSGISYREPSQPFEMGTGWYFRMDSSVSNSLLPILSPNGSVITGTKLNATYGFGLGAGFKFNNLLRAEGVFEASSLQKSSISTTKLSDGVTNIVCPASLVTVLDSNVNPLTNVASMLPLGYAWSQQTGTCSETRTATTRNMFVLTNAFIDLGTWWKVTPYVGAGMGVARISTIGNDNFYSNDNGALYQPTWTPGTSTPNVWVTNGGAAINPQPTIPNTTTPISTLVTPNWNKRFTAVQYNLALSGMAGVALDLTPNAKLDLGYRYLNYSDSKVRRYSQDVRIGFRYMVD